MIRSAHGPGLRPGRVLYGLSGLFFCLLLVSSWAWHTQAEQYHVQNWRRENGLPDGQITAIAQTPDGYLWIGTAKGLACFDGVRFKVFKAGETAGFTDSRISSLATDRQGTLWVGMLDGNLARRVNGSFCAMHPPVPLTFRPEQKRIPDTWLWDRRLAMIEEAEGTPRSNMEPLSDRWAQLTTDGQGAVWWHVSGLGLMRFQAGQWAVFTNAHGLAPETIRQLACDREGRVWCEAQGQLHLLAGEPANVSGAAVPLTGQWSVLAAASHGGLWVAEPRNSWLQEGGRVWRLAEGRWHDELSLSPPSPRPASTVITCLLQDREERLWCGTASGGVFFSNSKGEWQRLQPQGSFSQGYVSCLFADRQDNIWVGTVGDGLYRVRLQPATMLNLPPPFENAEINTTCATRDGSVWMGTAGSGAIRYDGAHFRSFGAAEGLANQHVCALFEDSHTNLWAGTSGGLFRWAQGRFAPVQGPPELGVWVKALFEDRAGRLWIGTIGGLVCLEKGRFSVYHLRPDRRYCDLRSLAEDASGNLWIGTIGEGLFQVPCHQPAQVRRVDEFPATDARALHYGPDRTLWVGGWGSGLFLMREGRFTTLTTQDGLPSDRLQSILSDAEGRLWLSSDNGLIGVSPQEARNYRRGESPPLACQHLSLAEGLANGGCSGSGQPVSTRTADGRLWFPNYEGVAVLEPRKVHPGLGIPKVLVESVLADGKELLPSAGGEWRASSGARRFEFAYTAPNLAFPGNMRFRHKLDGMDHDWVDAGARRVAYYSQLPPGQYRFHVMVGGSDSRWHAAEGVIQLRVVPRLWEHRWLQVLAGGILVGLIGGSLAWSQRRKYLLRLERLQMQNALENERRRIAQDLHDEFGSRLTGIALQGEAATQAGKIPSPAQAELVSMTQAVRQLIGTLNEVVWATNPANDSLANVIAYLCDYTEELLSSAHIKCRLEAPIPSELPVLILTAQKRHNLLLAFKEALNNSVRHAQAQTIWLKIQVEAGQLAVAIADDGRGFDPAKARAGGNGLSNLRSRMEAFGGRAEIRSQIGQGTTVTFTLPLAAGGNRT